jgi:hypothetical protein
MQQHHDNPEFIESQCQQRARLAQPSGLDLSFIDSFDILGAMGKISNPQPASYTTKRNNLAHRDLC